MYSFVADIHEARLASLVPARGTIQIRMDFTWSSFPAHRLDYTSECLWGKEAGLTNVSCVLTVCGWFLSYRFLVADV